MGGVAVDGLWIARYESHAVPQVLPGFSNAGICVFDAGRLFGGDALFFYLGTYRVARDSLLGTARIRQFNGPVGNAFGDDAEEFDVAFRCHIQDADSMYGTISRDDVPGVRLALVLQRKADLPRRP